MRIRRVIALAAVAVLQLAAGVASASVGGSARSGPLYATFSAPTHYPNCKQKWPIKVTATWNGHPAHASAKYQFLYGGAVVNTQYPFGGTSRNPGYHWYVFHGSFYDTGFGPFGARSVGYKLTVRAVVVDGHYAVYPGTWVVVQKASGCPTY